MYLHSSRKLKLLKLFLLATLVGIQSCSKSDNGKPSDDFYFTAKVGDKAWVANVPSNLNTTVAAGSFNGNMVIVVGAMAVGTDTSAIAVVFPDDIELNKTVQFNQADLTLLAYVSKDATAGFSTDYVRNARGTLTITGFDAAAKTIEGTFSADLIEASPGKGKMKITEGKFKTPFQAGSAPSLPKLKK